MDNLAWHGGGPGPWVLVFPVVWGFAVVAVVAVVTVVRRTEWRGRGGGWPGRAVAGEPSPIAVLARRFAAGEIDEDEYWRRLSVLDEHFGRDPRRRKGSII
ncbi:SHOCT domain-containing protein [Streptomyces sp. NBC_01190]|uniref:SHOCT domain-containing protein n=1 Tax=Streptomyces sp. NBC_01190 TaxID=2903767 RepID=UPI00386F745A|nr:SHOCT domain-containing protein [Streptomyces sp. NBC_01190]